MLPTKFFFNSGGSLSVFEYTCENISWILIASKAEGYEFARNNVNNNKKLLLIKIFFYTAYNIVALAIILCLLFYLNTFANDKMIPESVSRFSLSMFLRFVISVVEGSILLVIVFQINKRFLAGTNPSKIASITILKEIAILIITCAIFFYQIYQHHK
jgi:hypothetical protein